MGRYRVRLMVSLLVSLSAVALPWDSRRGVTAQSTTEPIDQTDVEALLAEAKRLFQ